MKNRLKQKLFAFIESMYVPVYLKIDDLQPTEEYANEVSLRRIGKYYQRYGKVQRISVYRFHHTNIIADGNNRAYYLWRIGLRQIPTNLHFFYLPEKDENGHIISSPVIDAEETRENGVFSVSDMRFEGNDFIFFHENKAESHI